MDVVKYYYKIRFSVRVLLFPFCFYFLLFELPFFQSFWCIKVGFKAHYVKWRILKIVG